MTGPGIASGTTGNTIMKPLRLMMAVIVLGLCISSAPLFGAGTVKVFILAGQSNMELVKKAQFAMNDVPEFKGNVKTIATDVLIDKAAEKLYPHWRDNFEEWEKTGSDRGYHYLGSAIWFNRIGKAMGKAMLEMLPKK